MKQLAKRLMPTLSVKALLASSLGGLEPARPVDELHASDLTKQDPEFCPREVVLMRLLKVERPPHRVNQAMRITWDEGRDKQHRINNYYLRDYMIGDWRCIRCGDFSHWSRHPHITGWPEHCVQVQGIDDGHRWEYVEPEFHHPSGFSGSMDGVVEFTSSTRRLVEVKIIKGDSSEKSSAPDFRSLKAPLAEHRIRTQLYLRLIAESTDTRTASIDVTAAHIIYMMRGHGLKDETGVISPFKEFIVTRDDARMERYIRMAHAVNGEMPEGICGTALCKRAKQCSVAKQCFSGKYPAKNRWSANL